MKTFDIQDIHVGDEVMLRWNGYPGVAHYLHGTWATVAQTARTRVAVRAHSEDQAGYPPRWVRLDQIARRERPRPRGRPLIEVLADDA